MSLFRPFRFPKVLKDSTLYTLGLGLLNGAKFLFIPIYAHYLIPEQYGLMGVINTINGFIIIFMILGTDEALTRFYYDYQNNLIELKSYLITLILFVISLVTIIIIISLLLVFPILNKYLLRGNATIYPYVLLIIGITSTTSLFSIFLSLFRAQQKAVAYVSAQIAKFIFMVGIVLVLLIVFKLGLKGILWGDFISTLIVVITLFCLFMIKLLKANDALNGLIKEEVRQLPNSSVHKLFINCAKKTKIIANLFDFDKLRRTLRYSLPLLPYTIANWATSASDRLILSRYLKMDEVGLYNLGYSLAIGMNMIVSAINLAYLPYFYDKAQNHPKSKELFARNIKYYVTSIGGACLAIMLFSKEAIALLAPPEYSKARGTMVIVTLAFLFLGFYLMAVLPLFYLKYTGKIAIISIIAAVINVSLNFILIPLFGIMGAAWATLMAYCLMFILAYHMAQKAYPIRYPKSYVLIITILVSIVGYVLQSQSVLIKVLVLIIYGIGISIALRLSHKPSNSF